MKKKREPFTPAQLRMAYKVATHYYLRRRSNGALEKQNIVAEELGLQPPRFSEYLNIAWQAGLIDVILTPPEGIGSDYHALRKLELRLFDKLEKFSPPLIDGEGNMVRKHKLCQIHIVPSGPPISSELNLTSNEWLSLRGHLMARICKKAAIEFYSLIKKTYKTRNEENLYCGIGWGRTCERTVSLMDISEDSYPSLVVCPLVGNVGQVPFDANVLAYELANRLSGTSINLPCPSVRPLKLELETLEPVSRALGEISHCQIALSGIGAAYYEHMPFKSKLVERKILTDKMLNKIIKQGAVAELQCHYFDINGHLIPYDVAGVVPVGIDIMGTRQMPRFLVVVSPDSEKILPAVVTIKAGICSDLVIDQGVALFLLDDKNNKKVGLES